MAIVTVIAEIQMTSENEIGNTTNEVMLLAISMPEW